MRHTARHRRRIHYNQLCILQILAEQVVFSIEQTFRIRGEQKKLMAMRVLREILEEHGLHFRHSLLHIAVEAAVASMNLLRRRAS